MTTVSCGFENNPGRLVRIGPTLVAEIGYDPNFRPGVQSRPAIPTAPYDALVDTGALVTCIDVDLADELNLSVAGQSASVAGVLGPGEMPRYRATIHLPDLNATFSGFIIGARLAAGSQRHSVIIGRDFLRRFRMVYDGPTGAVTLSA